MRLQHLLLEVLAEEGAEPFELLPRRRHQVLVAHLEERVRGQPPGRTPRPVDREHPGRRRTRRAVRPPGHLLERADAVAPVAHQVDELRVRPQLAQQVDVAEVARLLVAPAGLAVAARIRPVDRADRGPHGRRGVHDGLLHLLTVQTQVAELGAPPPDQGAGQPPAVALLGEVAEAPAPSEDLDEEAGLGRDGDPGVRGEHQREQSGARSRAPDDEHRPVRGHRAYTVARPPLPFTPAMNRSTRSRASPPARRDLLVAAAVTVLELSGLRTARRSRSRRPRWRPSDWCSRPRRESRWPGAGCTRGRCWRWWPLRSWRMPWSSSRSLRTAAGSPWPPSPWRGTRERLPSPAAAWSPRSRSPTCRRH